MKYLTFIAILFFIVFTFCTLHLTAQVNPGEDPEEPNPLEGICYLYDDAGNRTVRYVCGGPHPRPVPGNQPEEADVMLSKQDAANERDFFVKVYPNPANDFLQVVQQGLNSDAQVMVYSPDGREVLSQSLGDGQIAIRHLSAATYFLVIQGNGVKFTASFIKLE